MKDIFRVIVKGILILITAAVLVFIVMALFKAGLLFWFGKKVFAFAGGVLGLDYYTSLFASVSLTACLAMSFPFSLFSLFIGKRRLTVPLISIIVATLVWGSYNIWGNTNNFDQLSGESNLYIAETPEGRVECRGNNCKFEKKYGIRYVRVTSEMLIREANERKAQAEIERTKEDAAKEEAMKEAQKQEELVQQEQKEREEREAKDRLEQLALEREREARQRQELEVEAARQRLLAEQQERARMVEAERQREAARQQEVEQTRYRQSEAPREPYRTRRVVRQMRVGDLLFR